MFGCFRNLKVLGIKIDGDEDFFYITFPKSWMWIPIEITCRVPYGIDLDNINLWEHEFTEIALSYLPHLLGVYKLKLFSEESRPIAHIMTALHSITVFKGEILNSAEYEAKLISLKLMKT